jgi:hypothetical protein
VDWLVPERRSRPEVEVDVDDVDVPARLTQAIVVVAASRMNTENVSLW